MLNLNMNEIIKQSAKKIVDILKLTLEKGINRILAHDGRKYWVYVLLLFDLITNNFIIYEVPF